MIILVALSFNLTFLLQHLLEVDIEFAGPSLLVPILTSNFFLAFYTHNTPKRTQSPSFYLPLGIFFFFFSQRKKCTQVFEHLENTPVVNILVTSKRKLKYLSSRLPQKKIINISLNKRALAKKIKDSTQYTAAHKGKR